jgi:glutaredoxin-like protein NrdH
MDACDVTLYALSTCIHCKNCDVDQLEGEEKNIILEKIKEINPSCSFPTLIIGDRVIVGFREDKIRECLNL